MDQSVIMSSDEMTPRELLRGLDLHTSCSDFWITSFMLVPLGAFTSPIYLPLPCVTLLASVSLSVTGETSVMFRSELKVWNKQIWIKIWIHCLLLV